MQIQETNKIFYYLQGYYNLLKLKLGIETAGNIERFLNNGGPYDRDYLVNRVNYYNKLNHLIPIGEAKSSLSIKSFQRPIKPSAYFFDLIEYARFFDRELKLSYLFGDVTHVPLFPSLVKSRPATVENGNAVLLKLDKARHFKFVEDDIAFGKKKNMLIGRGVVTQPHRVDFFNKYFHHPLCDLGKVNDNGRNTEWLKPLIPISEHLKYKFILCLEGHDVATNLKWVMSSSSVAVMPQPRYETWFMEGSLIPDQHYICIKDDYSDLEERLNYFIDHPQQAMDISKNANQYVRQFQNKKQEHILNLLVLDKYFFYTGQTSGWTLG
jgi:hypothetical protein